MSLCALELGAEKVAGGLSQGQVRIAAVTRCQWEVGAEDNISGLFGRL